MRLVDTNVLLYATSTAPVDQAKSEVAQEVLRARDLALSAQVLQEFYVQSTRASREFRLTSEEARNIVSSLLRFPTAPVTVAIVRSAIVLAERWSLSYWDAAVIEAARSLGCEVVLSEDMGDGEDYDGVRVENPFRGCR